MTGIGAGVLVALSVLAAIWILNLIRHGKLYVGYGIVVLSIGAAVLGIALVPILRRLTLTILADLYPREPIAIVGLASILLLLVYVLHQLSVLSDRVATLTQEIAIRDAKDAPEPRT